MGTTSEEYTPSIQRYPLPKPSKGEPRWKSRDAIALCSDTQRMRGDFGVLSGELKTEPLTGKTDRSDVEEVTTEEVRTK